MDNQNNGYDFTEAVRAAAKAMADNANIAKEFESRFRGNVNSINDSVSRIMDYNNFITYDMELPANPTYELIEKTEETNMLLKEIRNNTDYLKLLANINENTQLSSEVLLEIQTDIFSIASATSKDEADNLFTRTLDKINSSGEVVGNIANLVSFLNAVYQVAVIKL